MAVTCRGALQRPRLAAQSRWWTGRGL